MCAHVSLSFSLSLSLYIYISLSISLYCLFPRSCRYDSMNLWGDRPRQKPGWRWSTLPILNARLLAREHLACWLGLGIENWHSKTKGGRSTWVVGSVGPRVKPQQTYLVSGRSSQCLTDQAHLVQRGLVQLNRSRLSWNCCGSHIIAAFAILIAWYTPHFGPPARNRTKLEQ